MTTSLPGHRPPHAAACLTRLLLLLFILCLPRAAGAQTADGSEGNPYVIDLSNINQSGDADNCYDFKDYAITLTATDGNKASPKYYKLTGSNSDYSISNKKAQTTADHIALLIDGMVQTERIDLYGNVTIDKFETIPATLNITAYANSFYINKGSNVTITANVTVVSTSTGSHAVVLEGALTVNGTLYGYGSVNLIGGSISDTNNTVLQWTFPTASKADLTVTKDASGSQTWTDFTIPANATATTISLFAPAGKYNLKKGTELYYGELVTGSPTTTFETTSGKVSSYSALPLPLDLKDISDALTLSYSKSGGWKYEVGSGGQEEAFSGVVNNTTKGGFFKHPITVTLDNSSGAVDATLVFDQAKNIGSSSGIALTIERKTTNANTVTLALDIDTMLEGATALKVGDGVTCAVPVKSEKSVTLMATDQAVELGTDAKLTGLSSVTFTEALGSNNSFIVPCIVYGNITEILSGTYKSFAFNLPYEYTVWSLFNDDPLTQYQGKPSTAAGSSDPYQTTFPAVTSGSDYVDYGLVPYALTPSGETTEITIDATENTDVRQIGSDDPTKPTTIQSLTIGGVTTDIILSNLTVKADGGGNGGTVEIGATNTTTAKFTLKGANTLGEVIVGSKGTLELSSAEEGATLKGTTFTNNGNLNDLAGLVEAVVVGTTGTTLSPGTITGNTEVSPGGTTPLTADIGIQTKAGSISSYLWQKKNEKDEWVTTGELSGTHATFTTGVGTYRCRVAYTDGTIRTVLPTKPVTVTEKTTLDLADVAANAAPRTSLNLTYGTDKSWQYSYKGKDNKPVEGSFTGELTNTGDAAFDCTIYVYLAAAGGTLTLPTTLKSNNTLYLQKEFGIPDGSLSLDLHITGTVSLSSLDVQKGCKLKLSHTADAPALALQILTLIEDATLETDRELTASQSLSAFLRKTVGQAWNVLGVPVAVKANHTGSEPWVLRTGFTSSANQKWGEGVKLDYAVSLPLSAGAAYIFANATDGSTTPPSETLMLQTAANAVIPVPVTPELGEALADGEFRFVANPNLCDIELSGIYTLSADGNRFDLQEGPVTVKAFKAFMVANAVTRRTLRSIGTGGDGTATGLAPALSDGSFRVWGSRGEMHLSASHPTDVKIVSLSGAVVREFRLEGDRVEQLPAGRIYLVVSGQITYKVIL